VRLYTVEEARALLPRVIPILEQMRNAFRAMRAHQSIVAGDARRARADGTSVVDPWLEGDGGAMPSADDTEALAKQIETLGIEIKDPERGLIDFYSEREGEVVYLCYLLGEDDLRYWHRLEDGFAGRQPL
jgi:hypothetical protein